LAAEVAATESKAAAAKTIAFESIRGRDMSVLSMRADDIERRHTGRKAWREETKGRVVLGEVLKRRLESF
jgi:hypothetical protein